jgi:uncharacterized protein (TIGR00661 family)
MKLLYAVQATGNGHLARARALAPALARHPSLQVDFLFSGRSRAEMFDMEPFGNFRCLHGLTLFHARGKINTLDTVSKNDWRSFSHDVRTLDLSRYDAIINDFEPVSAWASRLQNKPCIGISHQCAFRYRVPKVAGHPHSRILMRQFAPTQMHIGLHWHHFGEPILPPLIEHFERPSGFTPGKIVVYMGFETLADMEKMLAPFKDHRFHIYSKDVSVASQHGNLHFSPLSYQQFHEDLVDCEGVITNAGFELASECIQLGKKLLVKPLRGQFEQLSNALAIKQLGYGSVMPALGSRYVQEWLQKPSVLAHPFPAVATPLAQWIAAGSWSDIASLARAIWSSTN